MCTAGACKVLLKRGSCILMYALVTSQANASQSSSSHFKFVTDKDLCGQTVLQSALPNKCIVLLSVVLKKRLPLTVHKVYNYYF